MGITNFQIVYHPLNFPLPSLLNFDTLLRSEKPFNMISFVTILLLLTHGNLWPFNKNENFLRFQDGSYREEAESVSLIVKSWRDTGDTPCRQNHREEAKL
jgi:hypothetical protein